MPSLRLFVALWPDAAARQALAAYRDRWRWPEAARQVAPQNLHATLHFIGRFAVERVGALGDGLATVPAPALELQPSGAEVWKGGIAVLKLRGGPALARLHARIGAVLSALDIALDERPFAPHVTLAREAFGARPPPDLPAVEWRVEGFALVLSRAGAYEVLHTWGASDSGPARPA